MSFFKTKQRSAQDRAGRARPSIDTLHKLECRVCPLNKASVNSPKMAPSGAAHPTIYILGEAPGSEEDKLGEQFVGQSGKILRSSIPKKHIKEIRWNNVIRTRPPDNRTPQWQEIESCRPSIIRDIEATRPFAIFGFGATALHWVLGESRIMVWRGRRVPVRIGDHVCWFFPMVHPSYVLRNMKWEKDWEATHDGLVFKKDLQHALDQLWVLDPPQVEDPNNYYDGITLAYDLDSILDHLKQLKHEPYLAVDIETNCLRPYKAGAKILSIAIGTESKTLAFPLAHKQAKWSEKDLDTLHNLVYDYLSSDRNIKVCHNTAFELEWFAHFYNKRILRDTTWEDTQGQAYVLDERRAGLSLDFSCLANFGFALKNISDLDRSNLDNELLEDVLRYNALDTKYTHKLFHAQKQRLEENFVLDQFYEKEQKRRVPTMVLTQARGLVVDKKEVSSHAQTLDDKITTLSKNIHEMPEVKKYNKRWGEFSATSSEQVAKLLHEICGYDDVITKSGGYTSKEEVLSKIGTPFCEAVLELRTRSKLKSTYILPFLPGGGLIYPDGMIHTVLNTMFTETGRLSSELPNTQNYPSRKDKWIRSYIVPRKGNIFLSADYGQIEPRVIAAWSKDPTLTKALWENYDIHLHWAERIAYEYPSVVGGKRYLKDKKAMKIHRTNTKSNFVLAGFYGSDPDAISKRMKIPDSVGRTLLDEFWDTFDIVKKWQQKLIDQYWVDGYVQCITGRRRHAPLPGHRIINTPVQGSASDIVVDAMNRLSEQADQEGIDWLQAVLNIHDDLMFDLPEEIVEDALEHIVAEMLTVPYETMKTVPISVEVVCGYNWATMETIGTFSTETKT